MLCNFCIFAQRTIKYTIMATVKAFIRTSTKAKDFVNVRFRLTDGRNIQLFHKSDLKVNPTIRGWVLPSVRSGNCRWSSNSQKKRTNWQQN